MGKDIRRMLKHTFVYGSGVVLSKAVGFMLLPVYTRYLTPSDYGTLELLNLTIYFVGILVAMRLGAGIFRYYFYYDSDLEKRQVVSSSFLLVMVFSVVIVLLSFLFSRFIASIMLGNADLSPLVRLIFSANFFDVLGGIMLVYLQAKKRSYLYTLLSFLRLAVALTLNIIFIVVCDLGVLGVMLSALISAGLMFAYLFIIFLREVGFCFSKKIASQIVKYSLPLIPATLLMVVLHSADRYILKIFLPLEQVGIYSLGYKFGFLLQFLINVPFLKMWGPYQFEIYNNNKHQTLYPKVFTYYTLIALSFFLVLSIFIKEILHFVVGESFWEAYRVVPLVCFSYVLLGASHIFSAVIYIKDKTYLRLVITLIAAVVCIGANLALIPIFGIMGAAWATLGSFITLAVVTLIISSKICPIAYEWSRILKLCGCAAISYAATFLISYISIWTTLSVKILVFLTFYLLLFVFQFFEDKEKTTLRNLFTYVKKRILVLKQS